MRKIAEKI